MNTQLAALENAILSRARHLVDTQLHTAHQQREKILADANKQIRFKEERETETAKINAEQAYRRQVQASEIKLHAQLDQLRWSLIQSVMSNLKIRLLEVKQSENYLALLQQYFNQAVQAIEKDSLIIEVNDTDYELLLTGWDKMIQQTSKSCSLTKSAQTITGGMIVRSSDNRIRVDYSFEGLINQLEDDIYQMITALLFAEAGK